MGLSADRQTGSLSGPVLMFTPGIVLITGTTSGVGLNATCALVKRGWTVITANRSPQRAAAAADDLDLPKERLKHVLHFLVKVHCKLCVFLLCISVRAQV